MKKMLMLFLVMSVFMISLASSETVTTFNNSLSTEEIKYDTVVASVSPWTAASGLITTKTRYISIPEGSNVLSATINLSGAAEDCNDNVANGESWSGGTWYSNNRFDGNWGTRDIGQSNSYAQAFNNYTMPTNATNATLNFRVRSYNPTGVSDYVTRVYTHTEAIPEDCIDAGGTIKTYFITQQIGTDYSRMHCYNWTGATWVTLMNYGNDGYYYEDSMTYGMNDGSTCYQDFSDHFEAPASPTLKVDTTQVWSYSGEFNLTDNQTDDFAAELNAYIAANPAVNGTHDIPIVFTSNSEGIIEYDGLEVEYLQDTISDGNTTIIGFENSTWGENANLTMVSSADQTKWFSWLIDGVIKLAGWGENVFNWVFSNPIESPNSTVTLHTGDSANFTSINSFSDGNTSETLTFTAGETKTKYLTVPENNTVLNATIDLGSTQNIFCYQENAHQSSACGGIAGAAYVPVGAWVGAANFYDGIWTNTAYANPGPGYIYFNYTIPATALDTSFIQFRGEGSSATYQVYENFSIPSACWDPLSNNKLMFRAISNFPGTLYFALECNNGASWDVIKYQATPGRLPYVMEEAMWWNLGDVTMTTGSNQSWSFASDGGGTVDFADDLSYYIDNNNPSGGEYNVPIAFYSDLAGPMTYDNISVELELIPDVEAEFLIETTPAYPVITLNYPANGTVFNSSWEDISINFTVEDENLENCSYTIDGGDDIPVTCNTNFLHEVKRGTTIINYSAVDILGYVSSEELTIFGSDFIVNISNGTETIQLVNGTSYWEEAANITFDSSAPISSWFSWAVDGIVRLAGWGENVFNWVFNLPSDAPNATVTLKTINEADKSESDITFNNSLSTEYLHFTGSENITRWLSVPENFRFEEADINLTGTSDYPWASDTNVITGLSGVGSYGDPKVFLKDGTYYMIYGERYGNFGGYNWTGTTWQSDPGIVTGLTDVGDYSTVTVWEMDGNWHLMAGANNGLSTGFSWNESGSTWVSNSTMVAGITDRGDRSNPEVFEWEGTYYMLNGEYRGDFAAYRWIGSTWESYPAIDVGIESTGDYNGASVFVKDGTMHMIITDYNMGMGYNNGYTWNISESSWQVDATVRSGLGGGLYATGTAYQENGVWKFIMNANSGTFTGYSTTLPSNTSLEIGDTSIWNVTGNFNESEVSYDIISTLDDYMAANPAVGGTHLIPFTFHSDSVGVVEADLNINGAVPTIEEFEIVTNSTAPVITISSPVDDEELEGDIRINWTVEDATEVGSCWYNYNGTNVTINGTEGGEISIFPTDGLISFYEFEESSGPVVDTHGDNNLTNYLATPGATGIRNDAYDFDGSTGYMQDASFPGIVDTGFTIRAWVNPDTDTDTGYNRIVDFKTTVSGSYQTFLTSREDETNEGFRFSIFHDGAWTHVDQPGTQPADNWYHVVGTYNTTSGAMKLYVDGVNVANGTSAPGFSTNTGTFTVSRNPDGAFSYVDGTIDDVTIWNRPLTYEEISLLDNEGNSLAYNATSSNATGLIGDCSNGSLPIDFAKGYYNFTLWANDSVGNEGDSTVYDISVGNQNPLIQIDYPVNGASYSQSEPISVLNYSFSDQSASTCEYSINGGTNTTISCVAGTANILIDSSGSYIVNLYAEDSYGNTNMSTVTFDYTRLAYDESNVIYQCGEIVSSGDYVINNSPINGTSLINGTDCLNSSANGVNLIFQGEGSNVTFPLTDSDVLSGDFTAGTYINIADEYADIDSANLPALNRAANVSLNNGATSYLLVSIMRDGVPCTDCTSYTSNLNDAVVNFAVTGFSNYTIGDEPSVVLVSPSNLTAYNESRENISLVFNVTDTNLDSCWYNNNDGDNVSATCNVASDYLVKDGLNIITYYANDTDGNSNSTALYLYGGPFLINISDGVDSVEQINGTSYWDENVNLTFNSSSPTTSWFSWLVGGVEKLAGWGENVFNWVFNLPVGSNNETVTLDTHDNIIDDYNFNNSLASENITLEGGTDMTRWLEIPEDNKAVDAVIDVASFVDVYEQHTADEIGYDGTWYDSAGHENFRTTDNDWGTYGSTQYVVGVNMYVNYTIPGGYSPLHWEVKDTVGRVNVTLAEDCLDAFPDKLVLRGKVTANINPKPNTWYCHDGTDWVVVRNVDSFPSGARLYEESMWWTNTTNDPSISVGSTEVWSYSGDFGTSETTSDFADEINDYIDSISAVDGFYSIPLVFSSDTPGILGVTPNITGAYSTSEDFVIVTNSTLPVVTATAPTGVQPYIEYNQGANLTLEYSAADDNIDSCWYEYAGTNTSISCGGTSSVFAYVPVNDIITVYANDTVGNVNSASSNWSFILAMTDEDYDTSTVEGNAETISIDLLYDNTAWSAIVATLNYDDTEYTGTITGSGDSLVATGVAQVGAITPGENKSFYWTIGLTNSTGTYEFNSTAHEQTVGTVDFSLCSLNESPQLYFQTFSTTDTDLPVNATFESAWAIKNADGGEVALSRSFGDTSETNSSWAFCIEPNSSIYTVSIDITVDAANYTPTSHYIVDVDYSGGETQNVSLYLLEDDLSTLTEIKVTDQDNKPAEDVYVTIQRYDVGTDTYFDVAQVRTDSSGSDLAYLTWYDVWYKFVGVYEGEVEFIDGPKKISTTPQAFQIGEIQDLDYEKFGDITYSLVYNEATENFVLTYVDPTGLTSSNCLRVIKRNVTADYSICDTCQSSSSATIYCNTQPYGNGTFIASYYAEGSPAYWIDQIFEAKNAQNELYQEIGNDNGTGLAILIAGIILAMFLITPALGVMGAIIGMVVAVALGFQPLDYSAMIGIVAVGGLIMWAVQK